MTRQINWSGYVWNVMNYYASPGPNYYSDNTENVFMDALNNLHLKITNRNGIWYCVELDSVLTFGYGTYTINMVSNPYTTDIYGVAGLFYYLDNYDELDIEYSRWSDPSNNNLGQYTVQENPRTNSVESPTFYINEQNTINTIVWHSNGQVDFSVIRESDGSIINAWTFPAGYWTTKTGGNFDIDLWLIGGKPPSDGLEKELVLSSFSYVPEGSTQILGSVFPSNVTIISGNDQQFTALDTSGSIISGGVAWGVTSGTISNSGLYTAPMVTTSINYTVTAIYNSVQKSATVTVNPHTSQLTSIGISPTSINVNICENTQLSAVCEDQTGNAMTCPTLTWVSSDTVVATVDTTGKVTGISAGNANITTSSGSIVSNNSAITVSQVSGNMLLNPGFELSTVTKGMPDNWSKYPSNSTATFIYPAVGNDGSRAVGVAQTKKGLEQDWIQPVSSIVGGTNYEVNGYITTNHVAAPNSSLGAVIGVDWFDSSGKFIISRKAVHMAGTKPWTLLDATITAPSNATKANFFVALIGTGKALFDNVSFRKL